MTEAEWLACADPEEMLSFLGGLITDRTLRLFAVACARRVTRIGKDERLRVVLDVAERCAEDSTIVEEFRTARDVAQRAALDAFGARYKAEAEGGFDSTPRYYAFCARIRCERRSYCSLGQGFGAGLPGLGQVSSGESRLGDLSGQR
jgi:hypothetical protein